MCSLLSAAHSASHSCRGKYEDGQRGWELLRSPSLSPSPSPSLSLSLSLSLCSELRCSLSRSLSLSLRLSAGMMPTPTIPSLCHSFMVDWTARYLTIPFSFFFFFAVSPFIPLSFSLPLLICVPVSLLVQPLVAAFSQCCSWNQPLLTQNMKLAVNLLQDASWHEYQLKKKEKRNKCNIKKKTLKTHNILTK